jgi:outer membrane immunogenic protein
MKSLILAAAAAACVIPAAASAQVANSLQPVGYYGSIEYAGTHVEGADLGAVQGRLGARFGRFLGAEGEFGMGVKGDTVDVLGTNVDFRLNHQEAGYLVGFIPVSPNLDLFARGGYGHTRVRETALGVVDHFSENSWNYGAGAQYFLNGRDGIRADWTRHDFTGGSGVNADVWSVGYTRRF